MRWLHQDAPSRAPNTPAGVQRQFVRFVGANSGPGPEAARSEWFVSGTQQAEFALPARMHNANSRDAGNTVALRIIKPASGTIFALDPDIPSGHQRVRLQAQALGARRVPTHQQQAQPAGQLRWQLVPDQNSPVDNPAPASIIGTGMQADWLPQPGRHRIELLGPQGQMLDSVRVEVRGARAAR